MSETQIDPTKAKNALEDPIALLKQTGMGLFDFIKIFWSEVSEDEFQPNWHIPYLCEQLEEIAEGVGRNEPKKHNMIINIPPGTTKTITISIMFPIWCWTKWPWMKFICSSYSGALALESAEKSRDIVRSDKFKLFFPNMGIKEDKDTKSNFRIYTKKQMRPGQVPRMQYGGNRYSTSVGGTLTGFHGHILIVDDPLNPQQAASELELEKANYWIDQTLSTRKTNKKVTPTILVMQRLHQNDPSGYLLAKKKTNIKHISLPGEVRNYGKYLKPVELRSKYKDDLLDAERLDWEVLQELETDLGQFGYAGQIGQSPVPPGGGMFKVDNLLTIDSINKADIVQIWRYWDKAGSEGIGAYTAGVKMCRLKNGNFVVMSTIRGQWGTEVRERNLKTMAEADGREVRIGIEQEPGPVFVDSYVQMGDGSRKLLRDVKKGDIVINMKGVPTKVLAYHDQGMLETIIVRTDSGRELHLAKNHPVYTPEGWVDAGELVVGDVLGLKTNIQIKSVRNRTLEECRLAGYFVGDGCCTYARGNSINASIVSSDPIEGKDIIYCAESVGANVHVGGSRGWTYYLSGNGRPWLREVSLAGKTTDTKEVPEWVMCGDDEMAANFIGAYFACDGSVMNGKHHPCIEFYSTNKVLLEQVSSLLLRFGVYTMLRERTRRKTDHWKTRRRMFRLTTRKSDDSMAKFAERIPVYGVKADKLKVFKRKKFDIGIIPDPIVEILDNAPKECACLTVKDEDSFLVSDIIVHNSGGKESAQSTIKNLAGWHVEADRPTGDKAFRADPFSVQVNNGNVLLLKGEWNRDFKEELRYFPFGTYKDQVDAASGAFSKLTSKKIARRIR